METTHQIAPKPSARQFCPLKCQDNRISRLAKNAGMQMHSGEREKERRKKRKTLDLLPHCLLLSKVKGHHWQPLERIILIFKMACHSKKLIMRRKLDK
jgi:hypothetical protein